MSWRHWLGCSMLCVAGALAATSCGGTTSHDANNGTSGTAGSGTSGSGGSGAGSSGTSGAGGSEIRACSQPSDCTFVNAGCCSCGSPTINELVPVNTQHVQDVRPPNCDGPCPPCPQPPPDADTGQYFTATCTNGECTVVDIRETAITACQYASDCSLRDGANCCEGCGSSGWVAISDPVALTKLVCGDGPVGCPACLPAAPLLTAICTNGHCATQYTPCTDQHPCP